MVAHQNTGGPQGYKQQHAQGGPPTKDQLKLMQL